ncbi:MAG: tetraacyldisaccharide 4'-kinase [Elusimicrobia bacterium]|nr:tetraacyldisaccharide 4'-kinase [Elusimicrobiota bacterium]MBD3412422.1 tetraacyldisaccharide 4'-kinase [Elusimicrobiota bacterium]
MRLFVSIICSWMYAGIVMLRTFAYRIGLLPVHRLTVPVICVGNITAGGTGKTPAVIALSRMLDTMHKKHAVLTRGYGRKGKGMIMVSDGGVHRASHDTAGDEAFMMATLLPTVPIIADSNRPHGASWILDHFGKRIILMDDGFQHFALYRDLNICVIDAHDPWGGGHMLPRGLLREPKKAVTRAHLIMLTHCEMCSRECINRLSDEIIAMHQVPIIETVHAPIGLTNICTGVRHDCSWIHDRDIVAVSGIGNHRSFASTVESCGGRIARTFRFPDHYPYTVKEFQDIVAYGRRTGHPIITTAKDAARICSVMRKTENAYVLDIELRIVRGEDILENRLARL